MFDVFVEIGDRIRSNLKKPCLKKHLHITLEKHPIGLVECWRVFEEREEKSISSLFTLFEQWPVRLQFWRKKYRMNFWRTKEILIHRFNNECEWVPVRLQFCLLFNSADKLRYSEIKFGRKGWRRRSRLNQNTGISLACQIPTEEDYFEFNTKFIYTKVPRIKIPCAMAMEERKQGECLRKISSKLSKELKVWLSSRDYLERDQHNPGIYC